MKKRITNLILSITSLILTLCLLVIVVSAWYSANTSVKATGITGLTSNDPKVQFEETVTAVRTKLDGQIVTETYKVVSNSKLYLIKRVTSANGISIEEIFSEDDKKPLEILAMLPDEYVDITIGYSITSLDNAAYTVILNNIRGGSFKVKAYNQNQEMDVEYIHYATGAFKYKNISLKDAAGQVLDNFSNEDYTWISTYNPTNDDTTNLKIKILDHTWKSEYQTLYYTFRIYEDFSQYYRLIAQASESYGALLSDLRLSIENIFFII